MSWHKSSTAMSMMLIFGLFSETQIRIVGSIGISELFIFLVAPFYFVVDYRLLKKDGFVPIIGLAGLTFLGSLLSGWHNGTPMVPWIKGIAATYSLFAIPVVFHHFLRRDMGSFKWYLIGAALSGLITIFALRGGVEASMVQRAGHRFEGGELYFMTHFGGLCTLPCYAFYLSSPTVLSVVTFLFPSVYTVARTSSGRSAVLVTLLSVCILCYVRRGWRRMRIMRKHFFVVMIFGFILVSLIGSLYKTAARNGWLSEKAQQKYETQMGSSKNVGLLDMLMKGRGEFFVSFYAAFHEPFWGYGPWPIDKKGICQEFLYKYGDPEAIHQMEDYRKFLAAQGATHVTFGLPAHSMLIQNWVWYGLLGLPFWVYVLFKMFELMRKYIDAVPQWFGYLAVMLPTMSWAILFSPYSGRTMVGAFVSIVMFTIAVGRGRIPLQQDMWRDAWKRQCQN